MKWHIEFDQIAHRQLKKLDPHTAKQLITTQRAIASLDDPRSRGKALTGNFRGLWRYRIGDYRIICDIQDEALVIIALEIGHRRDIYHD